jgi:DNA-binding MarR family transcriptional regulator
MNARIIDLVIVLKNSCIFKEELVMEEFSLSPAEYRGILSIQPGNWISCGELAQKMGISVSRGSRVIDKLAKKGFIRQSDDSSDKRFMRLILASKGLKLKKKIDTMLEKCEQEIKSKIPKSELKVFLNSIDKLTSILQSN